MSALRVAKVKSCCFPCAKVFASSTFRYPYAAVIAARTSVVVAALVIALAVGGAVLWGAAVIGVGQYAEDICFDDLDGRADYGGYRTAAELWPPSFECRLLGNDAEPVVVQHRGIALGWLGATLV